MFRMNEGGAGHNGHGTRGDEGLMSSLSDKTGAGCAARQPSSHGDAKKFEEMQIRLIESVQAPNFASSLALPRCTGAHAQWMSLGCPGAPLAKPADPAYMHRLFVRSSAAD